MQRATLVLGAAYDLLFALLMLWFAQPIAGALRVPLASPAPYLQLIAVLLLMLAAFYALAAYDLRRYAMVPLIAAGGRLLGALLFALWARNEPDYPGLWVLALADGLFGMAHLVALGMTRTLVAR